MQTRIGKPDPPEGLVLFSTVRAIPADHGSFYDVCGFSYEGLIVASKGRPQGRRKKGDTPRTAVRSTGVMARGAGKSVAAGRRTDLVKLVRAGVERFILENATMEEFLRTLRMAGEPESLYAHQLTGNVLSRIVRQAIEKRKPKRRSAGRR